MMVWEIPVVVMVTGELEDKLLGGLVEVLWRDPLRPLPWVHGQYSMKANPPRTLESC